MSVFLDSSVLIAALVPSEDRHAACMELSMQGGHAVYAHAFLETFCTLTGGRLGKKVDADLTPQLLNETIMPKVRVVELGAEELLATLKLARKHGARGGVVYDFMHLAAARKVGAVTLYTLNMDDFRQLARSGDPVIQRP